MVGREIGESYSNCYSLFSTSPHILYTNDFSLNNHLGKCRYLLFFFFYCRSSNFISIGVASVGPNGARFCQKTKRAGRELKIGRRFSLLADRVSFHYKSCFTHVSTYQSPWTPSLFLIVSFPTDTWDSLVEFLSFLNSILMLINS